jgi:hypothetical protein
MGKVDGLRVMRERRAEEAEQRKVEQRRAEEAERRKVAELFTPVTYPVVAPSHSVTYKGVKGAARVARWRAGNPELNRNRQREYTRKHRAKAKANAIVEEMMRAMQ